MNAFVIPVLAVGLLSYMKFERIVEEAKNVENVVDPIGASMEMCKVAYTPL